MKTAKLKPPRHLLHSIREKGFSSEDGYLRVLDLTGELLDRWSITLLCPVCCERERQESFRLWRGQVQEVGPIFYQVHLQSQNLHWTTADEVRVIRYFIGECSRCGTCLWLSVPGYIKRDRFMSEAEKMAANAARVAKLRRMKTIVEERLKPGDEVERIKGRKDVFLGLFEHENAGNRRYYGWYGKFEFTEARGHRTTSKVNVVTILGYLGVDFRTA